MNQVKKQLFTLAFAFVFMAGAAFAQSNDSSIDQVGDGNAATVAQTGADNQSTIEQSAQGTSGGQPVAASAVVTQTGDDNVSSLNQDAFFGDHDATITQVGDDNYSSINTQNGGGIAMVNMQGSMNSLLGIGLQSGSSANQKNNNEFYLDILGDGNVVGMTQEFGSGDVDLTGSGNTVTLRQLAQSSYHTATISVDGSSNMINVNQAGDTGGTGGTGSVSTVDLLNGSDMNMVDVEQFGSNHMSTVTVDGMTNTSTVVQQP